MSDEQKSDAPDWGQIGADLKREAGRGVRAYGRMRLIVSLVLAVLMLPVLIVLVPGGFGWAAQTTLGDWAQYPAVAVGFVVLGFAYRALWLAVRRPDKRTDETAAVSSLPNDLL